MANRSIWHLERAEFVQLGGGSRRLSEAGKVVGTLHAVGGNYRDALGGRGVTLESGEGRAVGRRGAFGTSGATRLIEHSHCLVEIGEQDLWRFALGAALPRALWASLVLQVRRK